MVKSEEEVATIEIQDFRGEVGVKRGDIVFLFCVELPLAPTPCPKQPSRVRSHRALQIPISAVWGKYGTFRVVCSLPLLSAIITKY